MAPQPILIVEDDPNDQELILRALKRLNLANPVLIANDGQEALYILHGTGQPLPALVLLDLKLPKINGFEVLAKLRRDQRTRHLPVVILSSSSELEDIQRTYDTGANSYVRKPVSISEFNQAIAQVVKYWLSLNTSA
jgi:two-component system, response regulator